MNDWFVEGSDFEIDLKTGKYKILNVYGIKNVVDIINKKDKEIEKLNNIINELDKILEEDVILRSFYNGRMQYNKTLTEGGLLFREYIKSTLQELKGDL